MESEILKAIPGLGQYAALVLVVGLLIKFLSVLHLQIKEMAGQFMAELKESRKDFQSQLRELSGAVAENQQAYQDQVKGLFESHYSLSRETIVTVKNLELTVREVDKTVKELQVVVRSLPGFAPGPPALPPAREPREPREPRK